MAKLMATKLSIALFAATCLTPAGHADTRAAVSLTDGFKAPPQSARPRVWWHWMNGNVTQEGIKLDLEWMARVGIGGVQNFDAELQTPQVVEKRLVYMTPDWKQAFKFAAQTADDLGLEMAIAASPGWSESGGPWVAPKDGMKKLVWSETLVSGGKPYKGRLATPPSATGPFQDMPMTADLLTGGGNKALPTYYRDTQVIAYRDAGGALPAPKFSVSSTAADVSLLSDGRYAAALEIPAGTKDSPAWLRADFATPQQVRSASLAMPPAWLFGAGAFTPTLEASADGVTFAKVAEFPNKTSPQYTISFPAVTARALCIVFHPGSGAMNFPAPPAPGVDFSALGGMPGGGASTIKISEVSFSSTARVNRFEEKAGYAMTPDYYAIASADSAGVAATDVIDLTGKMQADGTLAWTPPAGTWRVLRFGATLTGKENHPATKEATGLEVDKFDADAVRRYINTYLDTYIDAAGSELIGKHGVRAVLNDSIEVGAANWTDHMAGEFKARRGYDAVPWLPALTGVVIGSAAKTDAFLYDYRQTLGELIAEAHYGTIAEELHKRGLIHYSEALESGRPSIGDDMAMRRHADVPMAAMWTYPAGDVGPQSQYWGDIRGAASVAHVYGQNLVAAESLTSAMAYWAYAPRDLQPMIDMEFALGVNRPVIHTSVHQPLTAKAPGFSLWIFGQFFNRLESWSEMAGPWVSYMARNAYMLQQGRFAADVAYFYGEEAPLTAQYETRVADDTPTTTGFDYVNADVLINQLTNDGSDVVAKSGARYKLIYLGGSSARMTLPVLKRLDALVQGGATLVGLKPSGSPSLSDDAESWKRIADGLWGGNTGKGRVLAAANINAALTELKIAPDFSASKPAADTTVMFVHRKLPVGDIYYFTNRKDRAETLDLSFRSIGAPEYWDAQTGTSTKLSYRIADGQTIVPMTLRPYQSGYIVFNGDKPAASVLTIAPPQVQPVATLDGAWQVAFQPGRGVAAATIALPASDWSKSDLPGVKYFSGTASYTRTITVPTSALAKGKRLFIDLGQVGDVAEVRVGGKLVGTAWKAPYHIDLTGSVKAGNNALEIRVANLWVNRLIGDAQPGATPITFTTLKTYTAAAPLRASGLIGPVKLELQF